jgi:hypothetical protein
LNLAAYHEMKTQNGPTGNLNTQVKTNHRGDYWLPTRKFAGTEAAQKLLDYQDELERKINYKRMQLTSDDEEAENFRDYLALPSMEKFLSEDRKTKTATLTRED